MPTPFLAAGIVLTAVAGLMAQDESLTRDDKGYWTRVSTRSINAPLQPRFKVISRGRIVLKGTDGGLGYRLRQQIRARSEEDARRMIGRESVNLQVQGGWTTLLVEPNSHPNVTTELEVDVPRNQPFASLESRLGGGIEAYDLQGSVEAATRAGLIRLDRIMGNVVGRTGGGEIRLGKIGGSVRCVSGGGSVYIDSTGRDANCTTAGGDIVVGESAGPLVLSTEGGNIQVRKAGANVEAHSREGLIEVLQAAGIVNADTSAGSIQVDASNGVRAESAAGMVRVKSAAGPINLAAAAGSILAELMAGGRLQDSTLMAGNGDITVLIPSNVPVSVMVRADSGLGPRIVSDFREFPSSQSVLLRAPAVVQGSINGGGPVLRLNAPAGVIYLKKIK